MTNKLNFNCRLVFSINFSCGLIVVTFAGAGIDLWPNKSPSSPIDNFMFSNNRDLRSGATSSGMFGATTGRAGALNGGVRSRNDSPSSGSPHPNVVIDNLVRQWQLAEQRLLTLIHNAYVPASDMTPAGGKLVRQRYSGFPLRKP